MVNPRARRALAVAAMLLAAAIALPRFLTHTPYQRLGVQLDISGRRALPRVDKVVAPPAVGLLEPNDVIISVDGVAFDASLQQQLRKDGWPRGPITLMVARRGQILELNVPPVRLSPYQRLRLFLYPMVAVIAAPLIAFLLVWRRPDLGTAWAFLWFATMQGLGVIFGMFQFPQIEASPGFQLYLKIYGWLALWYPASYLHFMAVFPRPRWGGAGKTRSVWFWLVVVSYLVPLGIIAYTQLAHARMDSPYLIFQTAVLPIGVASLLERYARRGRPGWEPTVAQRVLAVLVAISFLAGAALGAVADDPRVAVLMTIPLARVVITAITLAWLTSPLLIAYLIANDPAFDPRRLIARTFPYAVLSGAIAALYLLLVLISQRLFAAATGEEALAANVVAALAVAFAVAPLRGWLQRAIDRLFGRDREALRSALDQAGRDLLSALDSAEVRSTVESVLERGLGRTVEIEWPETGPPRLADPESVYEDFRPAVENLMMQAGIRLENLALQEQRAAAERRAAESREAATRAELRALHAQVQPHFLFNALNALSYLTESDPPAAQRFTERLADMLRYTVEAGERPAALLSEEIAFVEDYLGVARERYENTLEFRYRGARELLSEAVPPLLLQPLVENSLKHGIASGADALHLSLDAETKDGWLTLVFADDGAAAGNGGPGLGVGLQNLEQRVRVFAGADASMSVGAREGGGFAVTLRWRTNGAPR